MSGKNPRALISTFASLAFIFLVTTVNAQQPAPKQEPETKPTGNTVDAWRTAMPESEKTSPVDDEVVPASDVEESSEQIEKRLDLLERKLADAIKGRDAVTLKRIIADDFTLTGAQPAATLTDKIRYIESALRDDNLTAYNFEKLKVRVYGATAIVNAIYKPQPSVAGKETGVDVLITDVWVRQGKRWRVVTRHSSSTAKMP